MARPLSERTASAEPIAPAAAEAGLVRSIGRAFAAAISALLITTLVVNRSGAALRPVGTAAGASLAAGSVALSDDDQGRSLFELSDMTPARPVVRCIELHYEGTVLPVDLRMAAESTGALTAYLDVAIEQGTGGGYETCDGFVPAGGSDGWASDGTLYRGSLAELTATGPLTVARVVNRDDRRTFRITIAVRDTAAAMGLSATPELVWEVVPS